MKKLVVILAIMLPLVATAQRKGFKLVESVPSSEPKWVSAREHPDFIYVMGQEGTTLADAKNAAMQSVLSDIAMSVAVNVNGDITDRSVFNVSGDKVTYEESVVNNIKTKIAKIPAIQGIAIQKADVFYKRFYKKKTGEEYYVLYMRYPFNEFERRDLIKAYNQMEKEIDDKIAKYAEDIDDIKNVEDIKTSITALVGIKKELSDDDSRINQINTIIGMYNDVYNSIMIDVVDNIPGSVVVRLVYDNHIIETSQKPRVNSDCATDFDIRTNNGLWFIGYDSRFCYPQDGPTINVVFKAGAKNISKQIRIQF
ncbi:MAG: hypothetical protein MJZ90_01705 [Bacteroidales bacterium]|nr:hypothetical protein [Bacteroidales bacterium]